MNISPNSTNITYICGPTTELYEYFTEKIWPPIFFSLFSMAPVVCQLFCNVLLIRELAIRTRQKQAFNLSDVIHKKGKRDLKSVTRMLLVVCVFFILSSIPHCAQSVLRRRLIDKNSPHDVAKGLLVICVAQILMYSNSSINFLLYTVSGRLFRNELYSAIQNVRYRVFKWLGRSSQPAEPNFDLEIPDGIRKGKSTVPSLNFTDSKATEEERF